ncbi:TetR/AcrR family transcriptional regulator [Nocardioides sp.]|uniref:TetR/AcrR family transcriptional regulator n=1 Tax=Nocardioides sp. TaxID=35761 RepID=UPI00198DE608|nr:TetR/AcrR family transcriptional regulator [Nocardioides sp.]MBC7275652.1 TetR/AcrR family transcriptional regulator [Nocardioides sp.]
MSGSTRLPAAQRRELLVAAGVEIARAEGGRAVTLARVAEACGVSKPIAYRLFDSLTDLLTLMERQVVADYEAAVIGALEDARRDGASPAELLSVLARTYVDHSLGAGAVYETVSAARAATEEVEDHFFEVPDAFSRIWEMLGLPAGEETALLTMFLGAADNLVTAIQAGVIEQDAAVDRLVALFAPLVPAVPGMHS